MMLRLVLFIVSFSASTAFAFPTQDLVPGGLAVIPLGKNTETPSASFNNQPAMVIKLNGEWQALVGIPLAQPIGKLEILTQIPNRKTQTSNASTTAIYIHEFPYPEQRLTVSKNQVNPSEAELKRIRKEAALMRKVYTSFTPAQPFNGMIWPTQGRKSSDFGLRRFFNGEERNPHSGFDIAAPTGTPVIAPAAGKVVLTGNFFFNGNAVFIDHGQGLITMLCHLNSINIQEGTHVKAGTLVGTVGSTGRSTGPHLHWTTSLNNARINPLLLLSEGQPLLPTPLNPQ